MKTNAKEAALLATLCFLVLIGVSNALLFNVALPSVIADLNISTTKASLIITCYTCIIAIGALTYGKLSEQIQIRTLFLIGILLFISGSVLGYLTHDYELLIAARVIQASGGASFIPLSMITINHYLRPANKKLGLTLISSMIALGSGTGFLIGGVITTYFGWHSLFLFMLIIAVGFTGIYAFMPAAHINEGHAQQHFDLKGATILTVLIISFLLAFSLNLWLFVVTLLMILAMKAYAKKDLNNPFVDLKTLSMRPFQRLLVATSLNSASIVAVLYLFPLLLTHAYSVSPIVIGSILFAIALFSVGISFLAGRLLLTWSNKRLISIFTCVSIAGFLLMAGGTDHSLTLLIVALICIYAGYSSIQVGLNHSVSQILPASKSAAGFGQFNLINFVGMACGPALSSRMLSLNSSYLTIFLIFAALLTINLIIMRMERTAVSR